MDGTRFANLHSKRSIGRRFFLSSRPQVGDRLPCNTIPRSADGYKDKYFIAAPKTVDVEDYPLLWIDGGYVDVEGNKGDTFAVTGTGCVFVGDALNYSVVTIITLTNKALTTNFTATLLDKFVRLQTLDLASNLITQISLAGLTALQFITLTNNRLNVLKNYELLTELAANGVSDGLVETENYGKLQAANALGFASNTIVTFANYTIPSDFFQIYVVFEYTSNGSSQTIIASNSASDTGIFINSTNKVVLNFNGITVTPAQPQSISNGWHSLNIYRESATSLRIAVDGTSYGAFVFDTTGITLSQISRSATPFLGKVAELSISNFAHWKFVAETGSQVFDTLNTNRATISGTTTWVLVNDVKVLNYPNLEGWSYGVQRLLWSENFVNSVWAKTFVNPVVSFDAAINANVNTLTELVSGSSPHRAGQSVVLGENQNYTVTCLVKRGVGLRNFMIAFEGSGVLPVRSSFNLSNGTLGTTQQNVLTSSITLQSSGYYLCKVTFARTIAATHTVFITMISGLDAGSQNYVGDGVSSIVIGKVMFSSKESVYQPTTERSILNSVIPKRIGGDTDIFGNPLEFAAGALPYPDATIIADGEAAKTALLSDGWTVAIGETI